MSLAPSYIRIVNTFQARHTLTMYVSRATQKSVLPAEILPINYPDKNDIETRRRIPLLIGTNRNDGNFQLVQEIGEHQPERDKINYSNYTYYIFK